MTEPPRREATVAFCPNHGPVAAAEFFAGVVICPIDKMQCYTILMEAKRV